MIVIDEKAYKLGYDNSDDSDYFDLCDIVHRYCSMFSLPSKLLEQVFSNKLFEKC